ncbi:hypothetical protein [Microbulbifer sp. TYP-18]|uniref:hypothetical protein n=1 Tax=Microbulbifer sp. TYP-18 TaxID=3230024 RepID=UPI0034C6539A
MNQRLLPLYHRVGEIQVYHAWLDNSAVRGASSWAGLVQDELLFGCLAREAAYTARGQRPWHCSPLEGIEMEHNTDKTVFVLDLAEARLVRLALALCRELIACPETTTVSRDEAVRELRAAQDIFADHEARAKQLQVLNRELQGGCHANA